MPVGDQLTRAFLHTFTPVPFHSQLLRAFNATSFFTGKSSPRFEMVLNDLEIYFGDLVASALQFLNSSEPNLLHCFLANELAAGAMIITTNFDDYIERAFRRRFGTKPRVIANPAELREDRHVSGIIKVHGDLHTSKSRLCSTLRSVKDGLPAELQRLFRHLLASDSLFVFLGYSGLDHFDVTPAFLQARADGVVNSDAI
jgi:hypothetical protein